MNSICSEDFFIYVPSLYDEETLAHEIHKAWEKITLAERITVYTHSWDKREQEQQDVEAASSSTSYS